MRIVSVILLSLGLMACDPLIDLGNANKDRIYTLNYSGDVPSMQIDGPSIFVDEFTFTAGLDQEAILVKTPSGEQLQLSGVAWASHPSDMMREYLVNVLRSRASIRAYGVGSLDVSVGCRLGVKLVDFQLNSQLGEGENKWGDVAITLEYILLNLKDGSVIGEVRQSEITPVQTSGAEAIIESFQKGAQATSYKAADWVKTKASVCVR